MADKRQAKPNARGRNDDRVGRNDAYMMIRRSLWQSPRVSQLSPTARALMVELLSMYNGKNNGTLFLSTKDATERLGFSDHHAAKAAFDDLVAAKLITCTFKGYFNIRAGEVSRATAWNLNWIGSKGERLSSEELPAVDDAKLEKRTLQRMARRQRAMSRYHKDRQAGKFPAVETTTLSARRAVETTVTSLPIEVESTAPDPEKPSFASKPVTVESTTYILHHIPADNEDEPDPVTFIRTSVAEWWRSSGRNDRIRLAQKNGLEIAELLGFVDGSIDLPFPKAVALRACVRAAA